MDDCGTMLNPSEFRAAVRGPSCAANADADGVAAAFVVV